MNDDKPNPLIELGFNKEHLTHLRSTGQFDDYVKNQVNRMRATVHPDTGKGNTDLCARINAAYTTLQNNPQNLEDYIAGMHSISEYKQILEAMVGEFAGLKQKYVDLEKENETLRTKYSELLAGKTPVFEGEIKTPRTKTPPRTVRVEEPKTTTTGKYSFTESLTHARGIAALHRLGKEPLNADELLKARITQPKLYDNCFWTGTAIAYKAGTSLIKVIPNCEFLRNIPEDFSRNYITGFDFDKLKAEPLDTTKFKCGTNLTKTEILTHPVWLALVGGDKDLLKQYVDTTFACYEKRYRTADKLMGFYKVDKPTENILGAALVSILDYESDASG
ncbi:MAG: hypothetical protein AABX51_08780, partial [Nanoarchaeota archaeon]